MLKLVTAGAALALAAPAHAAASTAEPTPNTASISEASSPAAESPVTIAAQYECGLLTCSYVFTKGVTNTIASADPREVGELCARIPSPGNVACAAGVVIVIGTAKVARSRGQCLKVNWTRHVIPPPWWTSVDGSSRCR
ncbi:hypothetical protein [Amycolatopsis sp. NPDC049868]|uniref:hypothetical protein n=1 Tax=Amycolatopsis sp. NPDC049868 TaxID=3363934 RepID=UPI0037B39005